MRKTLSNDAYRPVKLPSSLDVALQEAAKAAGLSTSEYIRRALAAHLATSAPADPQHSPEVQHA